MSNPFETVSRLREYPDDKGEYRTLVVRNHWKQDDRVVLKIEGDGETKEFVVLAAELERAIRNAQRAHRNW